MRLIEDIGFSYKCLHKVVAKRDEDEQENFQEWVQETLVLEMIIAADDSSKDDYTLYCYCGRSPSRMPATSNAQFVCGDLYSLITAMSVEGYVSTQVVNSSIYTAKFFYFVIGEVVSIPLCYIILIFLMFHNSSL